MMTIALKTTRFLALIGIIGALCFSCSKDDDDDSSNNYLSFKCLIDGTSFEMTETPTNSIYPGVSSDSEVNSSVTPVTTTSSYGSSMDNDDNDEFAGFHIGEITYTGSEPDFALFRSLFTMGAKDYSADLSNGISVVLYIDGTLWSTALGSADQSQSSFSITSAREKETFGMKFLEVTATFECTVYDGNGNSKTITNGTYRGNFQNI